MPPEVKSPPVGSVNPKEININQQEQSRQLHLHGLELPCPETDIETVPDLLKTNRGQPPQERISLQNHKTVFFHERLRHCSGFHRQGLGNMDVIANQVVQSTLSLSRVADLQGECPQGNAEA